MKSTYSKISVSLLLALALTGCAMWPSLNAYSSLDPTVSQVPACLSLIAFEKGNDGKPDKSKPIDTYDVAKKCAYLTLEEFSRMLEDTGDFDRTASYAALGIGTGVGAVLGFNGTKDMLKGLGLLSGSLLGLTSIVKTDTQRAILGKALKDVSCLIRSANIVHEQDKDSLQTSMLVTSNNMECTKDNNTSCMIKVAFLDLSKAHTLYTKIRLTKLVTIPLDLASAVSEIRMDVRQKLNSMSNSQSILAEQQDRVNGMIGGLMAEKKREDAAKEKAILYTQLSDNTNRTEIEANLSKFKTDEPSAFDAQLTQVFKDCASETAKTAIGY